MVLSFLTSSERQYYKFSGNFSIAIEDTYLSFLRFSGAKLYIHSLNYTCSITKFLSFLNNSGKYSKTFGWIYKAFETKSLSFFRFSGHK